MDLTTGKLQRVLDGLSSQVTSSQEIKNRFVPMAKSCRAFSTVTSGTTSLTNAGFVLMKLGKAGDAQRVLERSLRIKRDLGQ